MAGKGRWPTQVGRLLLAVVLLGGTGCLSFCHPVAPADKETAAAAAALPEECRNHVYVFLVHGMDPLDFADLSGVRDYVQSLGFIKTYYGQLYHPWYFEKQIRKIHQEDPRARFVLIGFSFGANMVRNMANAVREDGIEIDLLIYLGGNTLENIQEDQPANACKIYNILATGCIWNGDTMDRAENLHYDNVWHFGSPTHPNTLQILARELPMVAARVPVVVRHIPPVPCHDPLPRPVTAHESDQPDEWDFLKATPNGVDYSRCPPHP